LRSPAVKFSPFYYYRKLDDSFFALALEYPVENATINFFLLTREPFL